MPGVTITISLDRRTLRRVDQLIRQRAYPSRSRAIEEAIEAMLERLDRRRLARECSKLDPAFEKTLAEEGMTVELAQWPEY